MTPGAPRLVVLVTGAGGQLGRDLVADLEEAGHEVHPFHRAALDVTDPDQVAAVVAERRPDVVVNCAAYTAVDAAESDIDRAFQVNALGPRHLAWQCQRTGALLCHLSTDYVFDGTARAPIDEWAPIGPLNVYGRSKAAGEAEVRALCPRHQIVRTSWLYGGDGPNFVLAILRRAREGGQVRVVADQRGRPTWTGHLAAALVRLLERGIPGTYHLCNAGETTWWGLARAAIDAAGIAAEVVPISTAEYPTVARRPEYSVLADRAWRGLGEPALPRWEEGVLAYVAELRRRGRPEVADDETGPPRSAVAGTRRPRAGG